MSITNKIICEVYKTIENLGGDSEILSIIGSWGDTLSDEDVLGCIEAYNRDGTCFSKILYKVGDTRR